MTVPAVVVLATTAHDIRQVLNEAGSIRLHDRLKQVIGHQIRQIMDSPKVRICPKQAASQLMDTCLTGSL